MKKLAMPCLLLAAIIAGLLSCSTKQISQDEITAFVDDFEKKAEYLSRRVTEESWARYGGSKMDSVDYFLRASRELYSDLKSLTRVKNYLTMTTNETYLRKLELIYRRLQRGIIDYDPSIISLVNFTAKRWKEEFPGISFENRLHSREQLHNQIIAEKDRQRRRDIYSVLMAGSDFIAEDMAALARRRNQAASRIGYNSYYDLMLRADGLDKADLGRLLEEMERISAGPYTLALDSIKNVLGVEDIRIWDIYHALHQYDGQVEAFYTADRQMGLLGATLGGLGFKLPALPLYFSPATDSGDDPEDNICVIHVPQDIRIPTRIADGKESLSRLFAQAGRALYALRIDPQDFLLMQPPSPGFEIGMARMISALTNLRGWQIKYAGMPEPLAVRSVADGKFLALYNLRRLLMEISFERALYDDPFADLNTVYAGLFVKYMMFPLEADVRPWATDPSYVTDPVSRQNRLIGEGIAAQTYHYLRGKYGAVLDDQHTREFLAQNYYRFGSRDDWQTLLERGTGERLKAEYILFFPYD